MFYGTLVSQRNKNRRNPNWLLRFARWIGRTLRHIGLYQFYRGRNHSHREAWDKAERTL